MSETETGEELQARLARDEARLAYDEARIAAEDEAIHENAIVANTGIAIAVVLAIAIAALVISVIALRRDVGALASAAPTDSVSTRSIQDAAVTSDKLSDSAVIRSVIADGAIGPQQLAADAVSGAHVAKNSLTGADVQESTLATVPGAQRANDATHLAGRPGSAYLSRVMTVEATSLTNAQQGKGPVVARCPAGTRVISGGAAVRGAARGIAIVSSTPDGDGAWSATAYARGSHQAWRLTASAICAAGGA